MEMTWRPVPHLLTWLEGKNQLVTVYLSRSLNLQLFILNIRPLKCQMVHIQGLERKIGIFCYLSPSVTLCISPVLCRVEWEIFQAVVLLNSLDFTHKVTDKGT